DGGRRRTVVRRGTRKRRKESAIDSPSVGFRSLLAGLHHIPGTPAAPAAVRGAQVVHPAASAVHRRYQDVLPRLVGDDLVAVAAQIGTAAGRRRLLMIPHRVIHRADGEDVNGVDILVVVVGEYLGTRGRGGDGPERLRAERLPGGEFAPLVVEHSFLQLVV